MTIELAQQAIKAAISGKWEKAIRINLAILKEDKQNIDALNRLARAYSELGMIKKTRTASKAVLKLDPYNSIAKKSLERWNGVKDKIPSSPEPPSTQTFLEEPGKTKILPLIHIGSYETLTNIDSGDELTLKTSGHRISVNTNAGKYVGRLHDDISGHLRNLIKNGNQYRIYVKSVKQSEVTVFIRETKRSEKLKDVLSFPIENTDHTPLSSSSRL